MADRSSIEWTDASWNPIRARVIDIQNDGSGKERIGWHCEHVSEGCRNCYAEGFNRRLGTGRDFRPGELYREEKKGFNNGEVKLFLDEQMLTQPLRWKKPRKIFVCSMTDAFADFVADEMLDKMFAVMALCPQHTFQVLTKRAVRMREYLTSHDRPLRRIHHYAVMADDATKTWWWCRNPKMAATPYNLYLQAPWPLPNVWLGVSAERQEEADLRIPHLLATPAAVRFLSLEPLLGPVNMTSINHRGVVGGHSALHDRGLGQVDWVIVGGESGREARPMHPDWTRALRDQCAGAGTAFFFKQWGEYLPVGQTLPGFGKVHGATAVKPGRMKLHYGGTPQQAPKHAFAERGVEAASTADGRLTFRVGKKAAGRLLDGVEHNEFPKVPA